MFNVGSQRRENTRARQFSLDMYNQQRRDALEDWNRQNTYDSPVEMMKRLKEAGLNPNLAYGSPTTAGQSSPVRSSSAQAPGTKAPSVDFGGIADALMLGLETRRIEAQTDNIEAMTRLTEERERTEITRNVGEGTRIQETQADIALKLQRYDQLQKTNPDEASKIKAQVDNLVQTLDNLKAQERNIESSTRGQDARTTFTLSENERREAMQAPTIAAAVQKVVNMRLQANKTIADTGNAKMKNEEIIARTNAILKGIGLTEAQKELLQKNIDWYDAKATQAIVESIVDKIVPNAKAPTILKRR